MGGGGGDCVGGERLCGVGVVGGGVAGWDFSWIG